MSEKEDYMIYTVAAAYKNYKEAERERNQKRKMFWYLADEYMEIIQAHPMNEGREWERKDKFRKGCEDCQFTAGELAEKIYEEEFGNDE